MPPEHYGYAFRATPVGLPYTAGGWGDGGHFAAGNYTTDVTPEIRGCWHTEVEAETRSTTPFERNLSIVLRWFF